MILNKEKREEFEKVVRPLMAFLGENCHPHVVVIVDNSRAELFEGCANFLTEEYIPD